MVEVGEEVEEEVVQADEGRLPQVTLVARVGGLAVDAVLLHPTRMLEVELSKVLEPGLHMAAVDTMGVVQHSLTRLVDGLLPGSSRFLSSVVHY